ncbi:hypothetical protein, partial [Rhodococcoides yunnanense]|uniref:hypothetical protein n=1 Tax=Rhodococcoides yunnanense TaxID=278209 RepID=UPI001C3FE0B8
CRGWLWVVLVLWVVVLWVVGLCRWVRWWCLGWCWVRVLWWLMVVVWVWVSMCLVVVFFGG